MKNSVWLMLEELGKKNGITEILVNSTDSIFIERNGQSIQLNAKLTKTDILEFIQDVAKYNEKVCNNDFPILDGKLPDGSRINIINEPFADGSPAISIRKYLNHIKSFDENANVFGLGPSWVTFFKALIKAKRNIVISGGTGAGKTTFLNVLINEIPRSQRIVTIEDTLELSVGLPNVVRLESGAKELASKTSLSVKDLVKNTLRMRPDRIIIGESRGAEFFDLLQAMNTGHDGSLTTIHSNSPKECLSRMETLYMMSGYDMPINVIRKHISGVVNFIIQIKRDKDGTRVISEINEIVGMEANVIVMSNIAHRVDGYLKFNDIVPSCMRDLHEKGGLPMDFFENF